jgi:murein DD-endopeptidase MepM/ murein hydrolase activator NlpD
MSLRKIGIVVGVCFVVVAGYFWFSKKENTSLPFITHTATRQELPIIKYGFNIRDYKAEIHKIGNDDVFGSIMDKYGFSHQSIDKMLKASDSSINLAKVIKGNEYILLSKKGVDSLNPTYFIYQKSDLEYGYFTFYSKDSFEYTHKIRPKRVEERMVASKIDGSLFETLDKNNVNDAMAMKMADVFKWSIDFYKVQKDDGFKIIFKERFVEDKSIGIDTISAILFMHKGTEHIAIYYPPTEAYYKEDGSELKNFFLKAPIKFDRISSRYTKSRFHPVQKRWKAHLGTDFAAPTGTPIHSTAAGVVLEAKRSVFNGNYVKVKHDKTYTTQYLHMSKIGKGMRPGARVDQGQVIGYVGSTGLASGPHVCYRFWKNGTQVDALKQEVSIHQPIDKRHKTSFDKIAKEVLKRLQGMEMK